MHGVHLTSRQSYSTVTKHLCNIIYSVEYNLQFLFRFSNSKTWKRKEIERNHNFDDRNIKLADFLHNVETK